MRRFRHLSSTCLRTAPPYTIPTPLRPFPTISAIRIFDITFELHHFILAGETGLILSGVFGLAIIVLVGLGL